MIFDQLEHKEFATPEGSISYWVTPHAGIDSQGAGNPCARGDASACNTSQANQPWLVFLPGLTANHRLFEKQVEHFIDKARLFVWDPPSHGESRPSRSRGRWMILPAGCTRYSPPKASRVRSWSVNRWVATRRKSSWSSSQAKRQGSSPSIHASLQRSYYTWWELAALRHTKLMYLSFPWKTLVRLGSSGNTTTHYGSKLMESMMLDYQKREYCELAAHGFRVLADAVSADRPYQIDCPYVLICGEEDRAGSAKRYNRAWEAQEGTPVYWIENAGHNSTAIILPK